MITMYDSIQLSQIPANAEAVAGYVNGQWPTYPEVVKRWPHAHHLSIAVSSWADAECLDVESGDATNDVAAAWVRRQRIRGIARPVIYTSVSNVSTLLRKLGAAGIGRNDIRLWTAHYSMRPHLCDRGCGFGMGTVADATQWTDKSGGLTLDESLCTPNFFGPILKSGTFRQWVVWVTRGRKGPRPRVPARIPTGWWKTLSLLVWYRKLTRKGAA